LRSSGLADISANWVDVDELPDVDKKNAAFAVFQRLDAADPVTDWGTEIIRDHAGQPEEGAAAVFAAR
jgi:hypothetical protein